MYRLCCSTYCLFVLFCVLFCVDCVVLWIVCFCCSMCCFVLIICCSMYCLFVLFYVLCVCKCVLYYCHRVSTQLQLNISYQSRRAQFSDTYSNHVSESVSLTIRSQHLTSVLTVVNLHGMLKLTGKFWNEFMMQTILFLCQGKTIWKYLSVHRFPIFERVLLSF